MQINPIYKPIHERFEEKLIQCIPPSDKPLYRSARYILENGGKRHRPMLALLTAMDLKGEIEEGYSAACALELIHNYSLIHDDLPCMDNDDLRRGRPSVHKAFGEALAVLCGDFLLTHAFYILSESTSLSMEKKLHLIAKLSYYSGGGELLEGQVLDLSMEGKIGHFYELVNIYLRKTSSLFCCALEFGAIIAGKHAQHGELLKQVGQKIGVAFQVSNDFKGKTKDQDQNKFTIFSLFTEKQAQQLIEKNVQEAVELLQKSERSFKMLIDFIRAMFDL